MTKTHIIVESDVVDNLTSTVSDRPLSAKQGKVLNDALAAAGTFVTTFSDLKAKLTSAQDKAIVLGADISCTETITAATNSLFLNGFTLSGSGNHVGFKQNNGTTFKVSGGTFKNFSNPSDWAGVFQVANGQTLVAEDCVFDNCTAATGGVIQDNGAATFVRCTFNGCKATDGNGGAVVIGAGALTLTDCACYGCTSAGGNIIGTYNDNHTQTNVKYVNCHVNGGGILVGYQDKTMTLNNVEIRACTADGDCAGLSTSGKVVANGLKITDCYAASGYAGLNAGASTASVELQGECVITGNRVAGQSMPCDATFKNLKLVGKLTGRVYIAGTQVVDGQFGTATSGAEFADGFKHEGTDASGGLVRLKGRIESDDEGNLILKWSDDPITDAGAVRIAQGAENANKYMVTDEAGNVVPLAIEKDPIIYTVRIFKNKEPTSGAGVLELYSNKSTDDVSTVDSRLALMQRYLRHVIVSKDSEGEPVAKPLDETNLEKYADGTTAHLDGTDGDVMLEVDTLFWKSYEFDDHWDIKFSPTAFDTGVASAHKYGGVYIPHNCYGMFNGYVDSNDRLRSISTSENPTNNMNIDTYYTKAHNAGDTYCVPNMMDITILKILHLFVYGTKNIQDYAKGRGGPELAICSVNQDFDPTKAWNNMRVVEEGITDHTHCCTTLGIMNFYGNMWWILCDNIKANGKYKFATDAADHHTLADITYNTAPSTWIEITGLYMHGEDTSYITEIYGGTLGTFLPTNIGGSSETYYCDSYSLRSYEGICCHGGAFNGEPLHSGIFCINDFMSKTAGWLDSNTRLVIRLTK